MVIVMIMNDLFRIVLSLSISGSVLILAILPICRLFRSRLSKRWQYYIWLVVVLRLLIPFSPEASVIGTMFGEQGPVQASYTAEQAPAQATEQAPAQANEAGEPILQESRPNVTVSPGELEAPANQMPIAGGVPRILGALPDFLWIAWLLIALILLIRKITIYQSFSKYIKAGKTEVSDPAILNLFGDICHQLGVKRPVELYVNGLISSPIMTGVFKPAVVLPALPAGEIELKYICLHELTHYKRGDIVYKWLLQIVLCLHWFNPLVHWMVHEANRNCEVSCDESLIRSLSAEEIELYGDTLLQSVKTPGEYREGIAALTLSENASHLNERLKAIKGFRKSTKGMAIITVVLSIVMFVGGYVLGAYSPAQTGAVLTADPDNALELAAPSGWAGSLQIPRQPQDGLIGFYLTTSPIDFGGRERIYAASGELDDTIFFVKDRFGAAITNVQGSTTVDGNVRLYEFSGTIHLAVNYVDTLYAYKVFKSADGGSVYIASDRFVPNRVHMGQSGFGTQGFGATMIDSELVPFGTLVSLTVKGVYSPELIVIVQRDDDGNIIQRDEYVPGAIPGSISPGENVAYIIIETHKANGSIDRSIHSRDAVFDSFAETFYTRSDGIVEIRMIWINWQLDSDALPGPEGELEGSWARFWMPPVPLATELFSGTYPHLMVLIFYADFSHVAYTLYEQDAARFLAGLDFSGLVETDDGSPLYVITVSEDGMSTSMSMVESDVVVIRAFVDGVEYNAGFHREVDIVSFGGRRGYFAEHDFGMFSTYYLQPPGFFDILYERATEFVRYGDEVR